jgi:hypothetical protein
VYGSDFVSTVLEVACPFCKSLRRAGPVLRLDQPHRARSATHSIRGSLPFSYRRAKKFVACKITSGRRSNYLSSRQNFAGPDFRGSTLKALHRVIEFNLWMGARLLLARHLTSPAGGRAFRRALGTTCKDESTGSVGVEQTVDTNMTNASQGGWIISPGWFAAATIRGAERSQGATVTSGHAVAVRSPLPTISLGRSSSARRISKTLPPRREDLTGLLERSSRDLHVERAEQNLDWARQPNVSCWHDLFRQDSLCSKRSLRSSEMARCVKKATLRPPRSRELKD